MALRTETLTQERLKEILHYDPITGIFTRLITTSSNAKIGMRAGNIGTDLYRYIRIDGVLYYEHRLAWFYINGYFPSIDIDHVNRDRSDNRIDNLREATRLENSFNCPARKHSITQVKGVGINKRTGRHNSVYREGGKRHWLGTFDTLEEAKAAYEAAVSHRGKFLPINSSENKNGIAL